MGEGDLNVTITPEMQTAQMVAALSKLTSAFNSFASNAGGSLAKVGPQGSAAGRKMADGFKKDGLNRIVKYGSDFRTAFGKNVQNFGTIFASRLAFAFATNLQRLLTNAFLFFPKAIGKAIEVGKEFEQQMIKTATVATVSMGGDVADAVASVKEGYSALIRSARDVAKATIFTATESSEALFEFVSAGLSASQAMGGLQVAADFAAATQTNLTTGTDILTQAMVSFNLGQEETARAADAMVLALNTTTLTVSRLQAGLRFAAPAAGAVGIAFADMITVLGRFTDVTKQGGIAGRALRFMIQSLIDPSKEMLEVLPRLGLTIGDLDIKTKGLNEVLKTLALTTMDATEATQMFGKRAGPVVTGALKDIRTEILLGTDSYKKFVDQLNSQKAGTIAQAQAGAFMQSVTGLMTKIKSKTEELLLKIWDKVKDTVEGILNDVIRLVDYIDANFDSIYEGIVILQAAAVAAISLIVLAFTSGLLRLGKMTEFAGDEVTKLTFLWKTFTTKSLVGLVALNNFIKMQLMRSIMLLGPVAVAAADFAIVGWMKFKAALVGIMTVLRLGFLTKIPAMFGGILAAIAKTAAGALALKLAAAAVILLIGVIFTKVIANLMGVGGTSKQVFTNILNWLKDFSRVALIYMKRWATKLDEWTTWVAGGITTALQAVWGVFKRIALGAKRIVKTMVDFAIIAIDKIPFGGNKALETLRQGLINLSDTIGDSIDGINTKLDKHKSRYQILMELEQARRLGREKDIAAAKILQAQIDEETAAMERLTEALRTRITNEDTVAIAQEKANTLSAALVQQINREFESVELRTAAMMAGGEALDNLIFWADKHNLTLTEAQLALNAEWIEMNRATAAAREAKVAAEELTKAKQDLIAEIRGFDHGEMVLKLKAIEAAMLRLKSGAEEVSNEALVGFQDSLIETRKALEGTGPAYEEARQKLDDQIESVTSLIEFQAELGDETVDLAEFFVALREKLGLAEESVWNLEDAMDTLSEAEVATLFEVMAEKLQNMTEKFDEGTANASRYAEEMEADLKAMVAAAKGSLLEGEDYFQDYIDSMYQRLVVDGTMTAEEFKAIIEGLADGETVSKFDGYMKEITTGFARAIGEMIFKSQSFSDFLEKLFKGLAKKIIFDLMTKLISGVSKVLETAFAATEAAEGAAKEAGKKMALATIAGYAAIIVGILVFVAWILGAFEKSDAKKTARNFGRSIGYAVTEGMQDAIKETSDEVGDTLTAFLMHLGEIIAEFGIETGMQLNRTLMTLNQIWSSVDQGFIGSKQAMDAFKAALIEVIPYISDFGTGFEWVLKGVMDMMNRVNLGLLSMEDQIGVLTEVLPLLMEEVIQTGGQGMDAVLKIIFELFDQVNAGILSTIEALKLIDPVINTIIENIGMFGVQGAAMLRALRDSARSVGIELQQINDFFIGLMKEALGHLADFTSGYTERVLGMRTSTREAIAKLREDLEEGIITIEEFRAAAKQLWDDYDKDIKKVLPTQAELRLSMSLTFAAFNELIASGMSLIDVYALMGDQMKELRRLIVEKFGSLKAAMGPSMRAFFGLFAKLGNDAVMSVMESFSALSGAFAAIGDAGMITLRDFVAFQNVLRTTFADLKAAGLTSKQALMAMAPDLARLRDLALAYGWALDQATLDLIQQADAAGLLPPAIEPIESIMGRIADILVILVEALGITLPDSVKTWGKTSELWFGRMSDDMIELARIYRSRGSTIEDVWDFATRAAEGYGKFTRKDFRDTAKAMGLSQEETKQFVKESIIAQRKAYREDARQKKNDDRAADKAEIDRAKNRRDRHITFFGQIERAGVQAWTLIGEAAQKAADDAIEAWGGVYQEVEGGSIFPDIRDGGERAFGGVSDAAVTSADVTTNAWMRDAFSNMDKRFTATPNIITAQIPRTGSDGVVSELQNLGRAIQGGQNVSVSLELSGRNMANFIVNTMKQESIDGRTPIDQGNIRSIDS